MDEHNTWTGNICITVLVPSYVVNGPRKLDAETFDTIPIGPNVEECSESFLFFEASNRFRCKARTWNPSSCRRFYVVPSKICWLVYFVINDFACTKHFPLKVEGKKISCSRFSSARVCVSEAESWMAEQKQHRVTTSVITYNVYRSWNHLYPLNWMTIRKKYTFIKAGRKPAPKTAARNEAKKEKNRMKAFSKWNVNRAYNHISKFIRETLRWWVLSERGDSYFPKVMRSCSDGIEI